MIKTAATKTVNNLLKAGLDGRVIDGRERRLFGGKFEDKKDGVRATILHLGAGQGNTSMP